METWTGRRALGRSGVEVSALGMGCWAIGGPLWYRMDPVGWGAAALAWIWARSPATIPIPGCRTVAQIEENAAALARGPLTRAQLDEIGAILG